VCFDNSTSGIIMGWSSPSQKMYLWISLILCQGRINNSGHHTNVRRGAFSHMRSQDFLCLGCTFLPPKKVDDLFSRRYVSECTFKCEQTTW